jgi:membrane fusion protein (multidrug efflux system)
MSVPHALKRAFFAFGLLVLVSACDQNDQKAAGGGAASAPAVGVSVVTTRSEDLPITNELPGRIAPTRIAEVRPRVSGIVVERVFEQGSIVKEGDVLYRIDPAPFKVEVDRARATLKRAEAAELQASQLADRQKELRDRNITSTQQLETAVAGLAQAAADVAAARAGVAAAELNLHYSEVRAPITGRIGRALITEGALVGTATADNLATIQQLDPVYADFTQSSGDLLALRRALKVGSLSSSDPGEAKVRLLFDDGQEYAHRGRLLFSEAAVDATTGQVTLRGEFPNPDGDLLPGMYVRVLIEQGIQHEAIAVPQQAVQRDGSGASKLYVVKPDNTVELRTVDIGRVLDNRWVVDGGLKAGENVVVEGFQKLRPGASVSPTQWKHAATPAPEGTEKPAAKAPSTN